MDVDDIIKLLFGFGFVVFAVLRALLKGKKGEQPAPSAASAAPDHATAWRDIGGADPAAGDAGTTSTIDKLAEDIASLLSDAEALAQRCDGRRELSRLRTPTRDELVAPLRQLATQLDRGELSGFAFTSARDTLAYLDELFEYLARMADQRLHKSSLAVVGDADAVADACYGPVAEFCSAHSVPLSTAIPVSVSGDWPLSIDLFFVRSKIAPILVPSSFSTSLAQWPALAHEIAHDFYNSVRGLAPALHQRLRVPQRAPLPLYPQQVDAGYLYQMFGPWLEEIFADVVGTMMLGPAYVTTMRTTFARPNRPEEAAVAWDLHGEIEPHPPSHVRVHVGCQVLDYLGRHDEAAAHREAWQQQHGGIDYVLIPLRTGKFLEIPDKPLLERASALVDVLLSEQHAILAGFHLIDIPGLSYLHGEHAQVEAMVPRLTEGRLVRGDARLIVAAAVLAADECPAAHGKILKATRASIVGVGTGEHVAEVAPGLDRAPGHGLDLAAAIRDPAMIRDAVILDAALGRRG